MARSHCFYEKLLVDKAHIDLIPSDRVYYLDPPKNPYKQPTWETEGWGELGWRGIYKRKDGSEYVVLFGKRYNIRRDERRRCWLTALK